MQIKLLMTKYKYAKYVNKIAYINTSALWYIILQAFFTDIDFHFSFSFF
jgi:hypothetical protein